MTSKAQTTVLLVGCMLSVIMPAFTQAQEAWSPTRPVRMLLGYTPGGAADVVARDLAPVMEKMLGQPVIVDYRPGAGGAIAVEALAISAPDGLTIGLVDGAPLTIIPNARKVSYDPLTGLSYLGIVTKSPLVILVNPTVPATTLPELLALVRANPGAISYATSGIGTIHQMSAELLGASTRTSMLHIPYKGAAPALTDLMGGAVKVSFSTIAPAAPLVKTGKVRAIAVTSSRQVAVFPGLKTVAEQGVPGYDAAGWFVLAGPKDMPSSIVARLNEALNAALKTPAIREKMAAQGNDAEPSSPAAASELVKADFQKWGRIIREQNLRFD
jgi:tripartite-type tricarboxylate transporter receptor subunit TctC